MDLTIFRTNLLSIIKQRRLSISALSDLSNLSEDTLRSVIYGKGNDIKLSTLVKIADALKMSIDELIQRRRYTFQEYKLYNDIQILPKYSLNIINTIIRVEKENLRNRKRITIPLLEPHGNMKDEMYYNGCTYKEFDITTYPNELKGNIKYAIKVTTNNFVPFCSINDILLVSIKHRPEYYDIIIYMDRSERLYIRKYTELGLEPINQLGDIILNNEIKNYIPLGVIVKVVKEFDVEQYR